MALNRAISIPILCGPLLQSIQDASDGLGLAQRLALHPDVSRRTAQRLLAGWVARGHIVALGEARARRYVEGSAGAANLSGVNGAERTADHFPTTIPLSADSRAILGVCELTRVELLRDLFVWAYERSTQEYLAIKQDLAEPDPLRLAYRDVIKQTVHAVVMHPGEDAMPLIAQAVAARVPEPDRAAVLSIAVDELRRLHEGVLARYGLRPSEFAAWKTQAARRISF